jgi:hypothetical protein
MMERLIDSPIRMPAGLARLLVHHIDGWLSAVTLL